jgi:hypothetical protein
VLLTRVVERENKNGAGNVTFPGAVFVGPFLGRGQAECQVRLQFSNPFEIQIESGARPAGRTFRVVGQEPKYELCLSGIVHLDRIIAYTCSQAGEEVFLENI